MITGLAPGLQKQVAGSSFYVGMRVLPPRERAAMYAVYAFCRLVDDIADDEQGHRPERLAALDDWRTDIEALYAGRADHSAAFLVDAVRQFDLAKEDFLTVIDGMAMDVERDIRWPSMDDLDIYCDRVASAVGRLSVRIFGMDRQPGVELAYHLGRALQLTNILRDVDADAEIGRMYLPLEALAAAGIPLSDPLTVAADPRVDIAARRVAVRAHDHYHEAGRILASRPQGRLLAPKLMQAVYAEQLARAEAIGWKPPRCTIKLSKPELLWTLLRVSLTR